MKRICLRKAPGRSSGSGWLPFSHIDFIKLQWTHQRGMVTLHDQMRESQRFVPPAHMDPDKFPGNTLRPEQSVEHHLQIHSGCGRKHAAGGKEAVKRQIAKMRLEQG